MKGLNVTRSWIEWARRTIVNGVPAAGIVLLTLIAAPAVAQDAAPAYSVLYSFTEGADGAFPVAGLIRDAAGNLYGTTSEGGISCLNGCGVLFKLDPAGNETVLHTFTGGADGANPLAGLIRDGAGNLYGTTLYGGNTSGSCFNGNSCGVVFKVDPTGNATALYTFTGGANGGNPEAGLIRDAAGNLYGTTAYGGDSNSCRGLGCGVVFRLDTKGNETVLYTFTGLADGGNPVAGLIQDAAGNLYGTTAWGGNHNFCHGLGCGVVFKLGPTGDETVLYAFKGPPDGASPVAGLVRDQAGNLYGTTVDGGALGKCNGSSPHGCGVVFKLDPAGNETVLYTFTGGADGQYPEAALTLDADGRLGGTTNSGGSNGGGVIFEVDQKGNETVFYQFGSQPGDATHPSAGLLRDRAGNFYGTTSAGGTYGWGAVFELSPH